MILKGQYVVLDCSLCLCFYSFIFYFIPKEPK